MNHEALKEAIRRRRGHGLNLEIILGPSHAEGMHGVDAEGESEGSDLAPHAEHMEEEVHGHKMAMNDAEDEEGMEEAEGIVPAGHPDEAQDEALIAKMIEEHDGKSPLREKMKHMASMKHASHKKY